MPFSSKASEAIHSAGYIAQLNFERIETYSMLRGKTYQIRKEREVRGDSKLYPMLKSYLRNLGHPIQDIEEPYST